MSKKIVKNQLVKYFKTPESALGFYANLIKKPMLSKAIVGVVSPKAAGSTSSEVIGWYILGISKEEGVFYSKQEVKAIGEPKMLSWKEIENVDIIEGFMINRIILNLIEGESLDFKVMKTLVGMNHSKKTQELKFLLSNINKQKNKLKSQ